VQRLAWPESVTTPVLTSVIIGCMFVATVLLCIVADRSGNRSVGWKTGGTSVAWTGPRCTIDIPLVRVM